jgi:hypothetical protein
MRRAASALAFSAAASALFSFDLVAFAQGQAPVPGEAERETPRPKDKAPAGKAGAKKEKPAPAKDKRKPIAPGFEGDEGAQAGGEEAPAKEPEPPKKKKTRGRDTGKDEPEEDIFKPIHINEQGDNERLIQDINATTGEVTLPQVIDEILADVIAELDTRPARALSPMAIRQVKLADNIKPSYSQKLQSLIIAQIHAGTRIRMVECVECETTRTKIENDQWIVERGITTTGQLRAIGEKLGVKTFMDVSFGFDPETGVLEMDFRVIRASDSFVIWSDSFRADETTPMLLRSSEGPIKRKDRLRDLEMLLEGRPYYGYVATAGFMIVPHNDPVNGDIYGATAGYRIYERFGTDRRVMFGLDLTGFLNTSRLAGAIVSAGSWWIPFRPDFINPEFRLGVKAGAFIAGTAGNAAVFQLGGEVLLRYRFGLYLYVLFMTRSEFPPNTNTFLGGVGGATGMSFNW